MEKQKLLPLVLSVRALNWKNDDSPLSDSITNLYTKIRERDDHTCRFCGFKDSFYQEIHHINDDHADNSERNLITACTFCHSVHHLTAVGKNQEGIIIWLPEIPQFKLNHINRSLLVMSSWADKLKRNTNRHKQVKEAHQLGQSAKITLKKLESRKEQATEIFKTSDPSILGGILQQILNENPEKYKRRSEFLHGLRVFYFGKKIKDNKDIMPRIIDGWTRNSGPYSAEPISWLKE